MTSPLTRSGERIRQAIGAAGFEVTPNELADALIEADDRIRPGPFGCCTKCGESYDRDFRYGLCDVCAFPPGQGAQDGGRYGAGTGNRPEKTKRDE